MVADLRPLPPHDNVVMALSCFNLIAAARPEGPAPRSRRRIPWIRGCELFSTHDLISVRLERL